MIKLSSINKYFIILFIVWPIGLLLPYLVESIPVKRTFQFVFLAIMLLCLVFGIRDKRQKGESVNYLEIGIVSGLGICLSLLIYYFIKHP